MKIAAMSGRLMGTVLAALAIRMELETRKA
jgi:hypothetical protein